MCWSCAGGAGCVYGHFKSAEEFEREVSKFLKANDILYLSTSKNDVPRCTPVGYFHNGMTVYVLSEGGGKFANLKANPKVSYAIASRIEGRMGILEVCGPSVLGAGIGHFHERGAGKVFPPDG